MNVTRIDRTRLQRPLITCLFLCLGMAFAVSLAASQQLERTWYGLYPLPAGGSVSVENVQGEISVEGWDRAEVEITAAKIGKDPDDHLEDVRVVTELGLESLAFRTVYPPHMDKPVGSITGCACRVRSIWLRCVPWRATSPYIALKVRWTRAR